MCSESTGDGDQVKIWSDLNIDDLNEREEKELFTRLSNRCDSIIEEQQKIIRQTNKRLNQVLTLVVILAIVYMMSFLVIIVNYENVLLDSILIISFVPLLLGVTMYSKAKNIPKNEDFSDYELDTSFENRFASDIVKVSNDFTSRGEHMIKSMAVEIEGNHRKLKSKSKMLRLSYIHIFLFVSTIPPLWLVITLIFY